ncbi:ferredoxin [Piscinibacter terrae]|uniref:ferredoxin n=1 Tax=Piscinibacter terrae TaxID=2496871 RepID=UPI000F5B0300|nr:ferredoxin [Albitalea terrae]
MNGIAAAVRSSMLNRHVVPRNVTNTVESQAPNHEREGSDPMPEVRLAPHVRGSVDLHGFMRAPGPFYTLGDVMQDGTWCGQCLSCGVPEAQAPSLLAPLTDTNSDTYFLRQPETEEEIEQACRAIEVCCVDALRYGGRDPKILARLSRTGCCDYSLQGGLASRTAPAPNAGRSEQTALSFLQRFGRGLLHAFRRKL